MINEQLLLSRLHDKKTRDSAFSEIVTLYSEKLYWVIRHIVGSHDDADDVVQETFIKAWNKIDYFRGDSQIGTWLHRIAVNEALDHLRREKKHLENDVELTNTSDSTTFADKYFDGDETERLLREAMNTLPEAQRAVFALKYFEDKPYKEISQILGTSEGGLKANYHYAVEKIKKHLQKSIILSYN